MQCKYGSRKKASAPDSINTNDIGAICALFNLEGSLCRLLDLVPETIQKILTFNFADGDGYKLFDEIILKVTKRTLGLLVDEITNRIPTAAFCAMEPPPMPEDITYSDVFIFFADLVPILSNFFAINDVLTGNSTRLLDKIVAAWLREQWFNNCECKIKPPPPNPLSNPYPPVTSSCLSELALEQLNAAIENINDGNEAQAQAQASEAAFNASVDLVESAEQWRDNLIANGSSVFDFRIDDLDPIIGVESSRNTFVNGGSWYIAVRIDEKKESYPIVKRAYVSTYDLMGNPQIDVDYLNLYTYEAPRAKVNIIDIDIVCESEPPTPTPPPDPNEFPKEEFCGLFPGDPLCNEDNNNNECEIEYVICAEAVECFPLRRPIRLVLNVTGIDVSVTVTEFSSCSNPRNTVDLILLECATPVTDDCADYEAALIAIATNISNNRIIRSEGYDQYRNLVDEIYTQYECENKSNNSYIEETFYTTYWNIKNANPDYGCTDVFAINYDPTASHDDGSCEY